MIYTYQCLECEDVFERVKPVERHAEPDNCDKCHSVAKRIITLPMYTDKGRFDAHFDPGLGKVFKTEYERKEHIRQNKLIEIGNEKINHDLNQKKIEERCKRRWDEV